MLQSVTKRDYVRYVSYLAETSTMAMRKNSANTINPVTYQTFIIDMEELSMHQMSYKPCQLNFFLFWQIANCFKLNFMSIDIYSQGCWYWTH